MGLEPEDPVADLEGLLSSLRIAEPSPAVPEEPAAEPSPSSAAEASGSASGSQDSWESWHSSVEPREPLRFYAVWHLPNNRYQLDLVGVHRGQGTAAYAQILLANNREFEGIRWRRADTLEAAQEIFRSEAEVHGVDPGKAERIFTWS